MGDLELPDLTLALAHCLGHLRSESAESKSLSSSQIHKSFKSFLECFCGKYVTNIEIGTCAAYAKMIPM